MVDNIDSATVFRRRRPEIPRSPALKITEDSFTDGDDEILESLVKTATSTPRATPRERKRTRNADRKSCKFNDAHNISYFDQFIFQIFYDFRLIVISEKVTNTRRFQNRTKYGIARELGLVLLKY